VLRRFAAMLMMAAAVAFTFETSFISTSEAEAGELDHIHHEHAAHHAPGTLAKTHIVTHVHADGTIHRHAVDDDELDDHVRQSGSPCWSMAVVVGVLPNLNACTVEAILIGKLAIEAVVPCLGTEPDVPGRPPRTPSIA
jgi:hypothetical protein